MDQLAEVLVRRDEHGTLDLRPLQHGVVRSARGELRHAIHLVTDRAKPFDDLPIDALAQLPITG